MHLRKAFLQLKQNPLFRKSIVLWLVNDVENYLIERERDHYQGRLRVDFQEQLLLLLLDLRILIRLDHVLDFFQENNLQSEYLPDWQSSFDNVDVEHLLQLAPMRQPVLV